MMKKSQTSLISISRLRPDTPEIAICARWRIDAFSDVLGTSHEQEVARLNAFASVPKGEAGFVAYWGEATAGTCLLAQKEIEPCHPLSPWLAGLFVDADFRRRGVGEALVRAVELEARQQGHDRIYLYTDETEPFYHKLGWTVEERGIWQGAPSVLMSRVVV
jgi:GNAT superfamily N-acetyltransferase